MNFGPSRNFSIFIEIVYVIVADAGWSSGWSSAFRLFAFKPELEFSLY